MASRTRNYASVFYPESCPDNFLEIIESWKVPVLLSPLHDSDLNPTGEPKKPHYHIMLCFDNVKTQEQARFYFEQLNCVGLEVVNSMRSYARYLCHLDNPDKHRYSTSDVTSFGSIDYVEICSSSADEIAAIAEIEDFIEVQDLLGYRSLCRLLRDVGRDDLYRILCTRSTLHFKAYLQSRQWEIEYEHRQDS